MCCYMPYLIVIICLGAFLLNFSFSENSGVDSSLNNNSNYYGSITHKEGFQL